jgi:farnesyl diphosphate synthase
VRADGGLGNYLDDCRERTQRALQRWLPPADTQPPRLHEAMRYAVLGDGKRIRPTLIYASGKSVGVAADRLEGLACAVEFIHAYSLIHDDLPAMDNDDLRRGRPTCHRRFDEATAVLAGDALQTLAFQVICQDPQLQVGDATRLRMLETLILASGSRGMAGGQALDMAATGRELDLTELENIHIHKTGALIRASVRLGALAAHGLDPATLKRLDRFSKCIGLAFQVQDDILDVTADTETLGKTGGKDAAADKATYVSLLGLEGAREKARELLELALEALGELGPAADELRALAAFVINREH